MAAYLGVDATEVKKRNFISAPDECQDESFASVPSDAASRPCFTGPAAGLDGVEGQPAGEGAPPEGPLQDDLPQEVMKTGDGKRFLASLFTLPRLWQQLQVRYTPMCMQGKAPANCCVYQPPPQSPQSPRSATHVACHLSATKFSRI